VIGADGKIQYERVAGHPGDRTYGNSVRSVVRGVVVDPCGQQGARPETAGTVPPDRPGRATAHSGVSRSAVDRPPPAGGGRRPDPLVDVSHPSPIAIDGVLTLVPPCHRRGRRHVVIYKLCFSGWTHGERLTRR
jgi:hypothetical protein